MLRFLHAALRSKVLLVGVLALTLPGLSAWASSHSDAPLISQDPQANLTDVYAFVGRQGNLAQKNLNIIVHVRPYSEPGNGAVYERFASDALYSIHIANPATGETLIRYDFRFTNDHPVTPPRLKNGGTILSYGNGTALSPILNVGDAGHNFTQIYSVTRSENSIAVLVATRLSTPPPNLRKRTTPHYNDPTTGFAISGATTAFGLDLYTRQTVHLLSTGDAVFAGSREDGFYGDVPGLFDLFDGRIFNTTATRAMVSARTAMASTVSRVSMSWPMRFVSHWQTCRALATRHRLPILPILCPPPGRPEALASTLQ